MMEVVSIYLLIPVGMLLTLAIELFIANIDKDKKRDEKRDKKRDNKDGRD
jgi:hypothetical protein